MLPGEAGTQAEGLGDLAASLGDRADSVLLGAQEIVNKRTADELYATMSALQGTLKAAQRTMEVYGNPNKGPTAQLTRTMATLERMAIRLDSAGNATQIVVQDVGCRPLELMVGRIAADIVQAHPWGAVRHTQRFMQDGGTVPELVEAVALAMIEDGVHCYNTCGREVIEAAEQRAVEPARPSS